MDGRIVRCGIISSCQAAATSEIGHESDSRNQRCIKYRILLRFTLLVPGMQLTSLTTV